MKIIYCIAGTYNPGGMERVLANKANWLARHGHTVVIVTTDQKGRNPYFDLDDRIRCVDLEIGYENNNGKSLWNKLLHYPHKQWVHKRRLTKLLRREQADVTVSMFCNEAGFITNIRDGSKKVLEVHFSKFKRLQYSRKGLWRFFDALRSWRDERTVRKFDKFVVLTKEDSEYWGNLPNMEVIPNACPFTPLQTARLEEKRIVAVGRYSHQKGFERLIDAWNKIKGAFPDWRLDIVGDGEERGRLQSLIHNYGIGQTVSLKKPTKKMSEVYTNASILVSSSRYEGLPMVMIEAQTYGLPIVAFECKCGPRDVITHGVTGLLVPEGDIDGLASQMALLMKDEYLRLSMGRMAKIASSRYDEERIMAEWTDLFKSLQEE